MSVIGAVSPPGGDLSDPVVQGTLRTVRVFWSLEDTLAYARHFPAISWLSSYSLYVDVLSDFYRKEMGEDWNRIRVKAMSILRREAELLEMVRLVGIDALSSSDRLILETARSIREDFLQQNAFMAEDTYTSLKKQYRIMKLIDLFDELARESLEAGVDLEKIIALPVKVDISRAKLISEDRLDEFDNIEKKIRESFSALEKEVQHA